MMKTLKGRALIGWMPRSEAVRFLLEDCIFAPPINANEAEKIWLNYRGQAEALPERVPSIPTRLGLNLQELAHSQKFRAFLSSLGPNNIIDVVKINPLDLRVIQYYVVTDRAEAYTNSMQDSSRYLQEMLPTSIKPTQVKITGQQFGLNTSFDVDLEHAEHFFSFDPRTGFSVQQALRHVTIMQTANAAYLTAGYHRCFARCSSVPIATVPTAVVALALNTLTSPPPTLNAVVGVADLGLDPHGKRAALFADFFTDGLFMDVNLRRKRFQLQVRSTWVSLDDNTSP